MVQGIKDKLNKEVNFTWWNLTKILLTIFLPQAIAISVVLINDHYSIRALEDTIEKKADAQDLAEYIKLEKMRHDLTCQMTKDNNSHLMRFMDEINKRIDRLEQRIFKQESYRGDSISENYFLEYGLSLQIRSGFWPGDYCKPTPLI